MLDQVGVLSHAQPGNVITAEDVTRFLGAVNEETLIEILSAIAEQDAGKLLRLLDSLKQEGMEPRVLVQAMTESIRNLMIAHTCADDNPETTRTLLGVNDSLFDNLCTLAKQFKKEEFPQFLIKISELDKQLRQTQAPQLWLETGLLELTYRHEIATISDLQQRLTALEQGAPIATGMKAPQAPQSAQAQSPQVQAPQAATSPSATIATPAPQPAASTPSSPIANNNITVATPAPTQPPATQQVQSPPSESTAVTPSSGAIDWSAIVQAIASIPTKAMVQQHAHLIGLDGNVLMVGCSSQGILNTLKVPSKLIHLNKAVEAVTGQSYDVRLEVGTVPSVGNIPPAPQPQANPVPASPSAAVSIPVPAMASQTPQQAEAPIASDTPPPPSPKRPALMLDDMPISVNNNPVSQTVSTSSAMPQQNGQARESNALPSTDANFTPEDIAEAKSHVATLLQGKEI
jgi:DNA polymerase-3 subunit gamma/tau